MFTTRILFTLIWATNMFKSGFFSLWPIPDVRELLRIFRNSVLKLDTDTYQSQSMSPDLYQYQVNKRSCSLQLIVWRLWQSSFKLKKDLLAITRTALPTAQLIFFYHRGEIDIRIVGKCLWRGMGLGNIRWFETNWLLPTSFRVQGKPRILEALHSQLYSLGYFFGALSPIMPRH